MQKFNPLLPVHDLSRGGGGVPQSQIYRLADKLKDMYQASHDLREKTLTPWDAGISDEVIKCYNDMKNFNNIRTKGNFVKFNNPLTEKKSGEKQDQNFVLYPSNTSQYIVY